MPMQDLKHSELPVVDQIEEQNVQRFVDGETIRTKA